ncbi:MAG: hypothetical protein DDT42_01224 [candidate division WS2 bacterium]|uniref:Helicase ATP-binding domain-containing protein n=1 Tax=Psychracetigena formicireducens TaxID=2986056 RepID=A0A9E2BGX5_PSYF1|nr:hypothetical protein [Candidatus Psychracetigena formicireducens]MBT9145353.1 hypothetical protein [Candidatus Psychracetigena formicireducens]
MGESPVTVGGLFLETTKDEYGLLESGRIRKFQGDFIRALNNDFDIICLSAPTASGKTLCFEYVFKRGKKVLLIYPTNALIEDQYKALSRRWCVKKLRAKDLEGKGRERTSELQATIEKYDIVLTNPDIINAIANKLYVNPSQDLLRFFEKFQYIIYDEFHFYEEFELSGILLQIVLFLNMRYSKVILSSATPSKEFIKNLRTVEMIDTRNPPKIGFIEAKGQDKKTSVNDHHIKYDVEVYFHDGLIYEDNLEDVIEELRKYRKAIRDNRIKGAIIFNSVKDANSFYNRVFEEFGGYIEIDTGYETKASIKIEEKPILITTAKGEVGLNLDIDFLFMEEGFFYNSFIQRFGRIGRHKPGKCYIFTKKKVSLDDKIAYYDFLGYFSNLMKDYVLNREIIDTLFDLRCYFVVREFGKHREKLNIVFKGSKFKKFNKFFTILDKQMEELRGFMGDTLYYRAIKTYLDSLLRSLKGLRGILYKNRFYTEGGNNMWIRNMI